MAKARCANYGCLRKGISFQNGHLSVFSVVQFIVDVIMSALTNVTMTRVKPHIYFQIDYSLSDQTLKSCNLKMCLTIHCSIKGGIYLTKHFQTLNVTRDKMVTITYGLRYIVQTTIIQLLFNMESKLET